MPMIGRELGRYRIESKLGEGDMGVVYGALHTALNRHVALKVLAADRVADPAGVHATKRHAGRLRLLFVDAATLAHTSGIDIIANAAIGVSATADGHGIVYVKVDAAVNDLMLVEGFR